MLVSFSPFTSAEPVRCVADMKPAVCKIDGSDLVVEIEAQAAIDAFSGVDAAVQDSQLNAKALLAKIVAQLRCDNTGCSGITSEASACPQPNSANGRSSVKLLASHIAWSVICEGDSVVRSRLSWRKRISQ